MTSITAHEESAAGLERELRLSPGLVVASLLALGVLVFLATERTSGALLRGQAQWLVVLLHVGAGVTWLLLAWHPPAGRWFAAIVPTAYVYLAGTCLRIPQAQSLQVIPVVLATALAGVPAAVAAALAASLFLAGPELAGSGAGARAAWVNLAAVWAVCGLLCCVDLRVQRVVQWACGYFQRAQALVDEARARKVALEQALADLAHANRQLALANERSATLRLIAEDAQKSKAEFVARVSHEFRTPLNMIIG
ncbi:MAG: hypothetical protein QME94_17465, partial [Anaerolineae bacterium]|nr:hypothetical protein [Anaerolineae bacterium]